MRYFVPPTKDEFKLLLNTTACAPILQTVLNNLPNEEQKIAIEILSQAFGRVPRVLTEFSDYLIKIGGQMTFKEISMYLSIHLTNTLT